MYYKNYGAHALYITNPNMGHWFDEKIIPEGLEEFIFENIPGSGFTMENKKFSKSDEKWRLNGYLGKFD